MPHESRFLTRPPVTTFETKASVGQVPMFRGDNRLPNKPYRMLPTTPTHAHCALSFASPSHEANKPWLAWHGNVITVMNEARSQFCFTVYCQTK